MIRGLSILTVCMNRQHHLLTSAERISSWPHHEEHLILDWSSQEPLRRNQLPNDSRIRLERVEKEDRWNLCRAYNFAAQLAKGNLLLKLDADCWPDDFDPAAYFVGGYDTCWFGSGLDGRLGQFLMSRKSFEAVGGFNEVLMGYGFDDKDLKARLQSLDIRVLALAENAIGVIPHSIHERVSREKELSHSNSFYQESLSSAYRRTTSISNRVSAAHYPWSSQRQGTRYVNLNPNIWTAVPHSIPELRTQVVDELRSLRRQVFWGEFLLVPAAVIRLLPQMLLSSDTNGRFKISWLHKVYCLTVTRFLVMVVNLMSPKFWKS